MYLHILLVTVSTYEYIQRQTDIATQTDRQTDKRKNYTFSQTDRQSDRQGLDDQIG